LWLWLFGRWIVHAGRLSSPVSGATRKLLLAMTAKISGTATLFDALN
jgi:hypothetical protein